MNAQEIQKEIRSAMYAVANELGFYHGDGSMLETSIHPMLKSHAYEAGMEIARKAHLPPKLIDKRPDEQKELDASKWLDDLTLTKQQGDAVISHLQGYESIAAVNRAVYAECEDGF